MPFASVGVVLLRKWHLKGLFKPIHFFYALKLRGNGDEQIKAANENGERETPECGISLKKGYSRTSSSGCLNRGATLHRWVIQAFFEPYVGSKVKRFQVWHPLVCGRLTRPIRMVKPKWRSTFPLTLKLSLKPEPLDECPTHNIPIACKRRALSFVPSQDVVFGLVNYMTREEKSMLKVEGMALLLTSKKCIVPFWCETG